MVDRFRWDGTPLTLAELDFMAGVLAKDVAPGTAKFVYTINVQIVRHFLGKEWHRTHAFFDAKAGSFLRPEFDGGDRDATYSVNFLSLAEMLFNLQDVAGFPSVLQHMVLNQTESAFAELQVGALLRQSDVTFSYIDPATMPGRAYDLEIVLPDAVGCGEIKCKYNSTPYNPEAVRKAVKDARGQIPKGADGVVFIKVPQHWLDEWSVDARMRANVSMPDAVVAAARDALRNASRVKRIVFYAFHLAVDPDIVGVTHYIGEATNPKNPPNSPWSRELLANMGQGNWLTIPEMNERWSANA